MNGTKGVGLGEGDKINRELEMGKGPSMVLQTKQNKKKGTSQATRSVWMKK